MYYMKKKNQTFKFEYLITSSSFVNQRKKLVIKFNLKNFLPTKVTLWNYKCMLLYSNQFSPSIKW